jgi:hypothetical protein
MPMLIAVKYYGFRLTIRFDFVPVF